MKQFVKLLPFALLAAVGCFFLLSGTTHAATIPVSTNDTASTVDSDCTLREAIENINAQSATNTDCAAGDGNNDTITIPSGIVTLTDNFPVITASVKIVGDGLGRTAVDGASAWHGLRASGGSTVTLSIEDLSIQGFADSGISVDGANLSVARTHIDGSNSIAAGSLAGIAIQAQQNITVLVEDTYIHDIATNSAQVGIVSGILMLNKGNIDTTIRRTTVSKVSSASPSNAAAGGIFGLTGLFDGAGTPADFTVDFENITVTEVSSAFTTVGVGLVGAALGGTSHVSGSISNSTVTNISSALGSDSSSGGAVILEAAAFTPSDGYIVEVSLQNLLVSAPALENCEIIDASTSFGGTGTATLGVTSTGGNLSDDNSCSSYFTHPTDQNNVTGLGASLAALADNGGFVPTMALLEGSPAIDSGTTVSGLTTDARLAVRPQGTAYDSGAYESLYNKPPTPTLAKSGQGITLGAALAASTTLTGLILFRRRHAYKLV